MFSSKFLFSDSKTFQWGFVILSGCLINNRKVSLPGFCWIDQLSFRWNIRFRYVQPPNWHILTWSSKPHLIYPQICFLFLKKTIYQYNICWPCKFRAKRDSSPIFQIRASCPTVPKHQSIFKPHVWIIMKVCWLQF